MSDYLNKLEGIGFIKEENPNRVPTAYTLDLGHNRHFVLEWPGTKYQRGFFIENYGEENSEIIYCLESKFLSLEYFIQNSNPGDDYCITEEYLISKGFLEDNDVYTFANDVNFINVEFWSEGIVRVQYFCENKLTTISVEYDQKNIFLSRKRFDEIFEKIKSKV